MSSEFLRSEAQEPEEDDGEQSSEELPAEVEKIYQNLEKSLRNAEPNSVRLIAFHDFARVLEARDWNETIGRKAEADPKNMRLQSRLRRAEIAREIAMSDLSKGPFLYRGYADELSDIQEATGSIQDGWEDAGFSSDESFKNTLDNIVTLKESLSKPGTYPRGASPQNK